MGSANEASKAMNEEREGMGKEHRGKECKEQEGGGRRQRSCGGIGESLEMI